jgi:hypothetical protein
MKFIPQINKYLIECYKIIFISQYNIKKKEEIVEQAPQEEPNPLMRKKKTPEELAAEAEAEDLDDFTSEYYIVKVQHLFLNFWCLKTNFIPIFYNSILYKTTINFIKIKVGFSRNIV